MSLDENKYCMSLRTVVCPVEVNPTGLINLVECTEGCGTVEAEIVRTETAKYVFCCRCHEYLGMVYKYGAGII